MAVSDSARFRILMLMKEKGAIRGVDIAKELSLATSTVSHHLEQLKVSGLLHEEQVKSSKYFSINKNSIKDLSEIFGLLGQIVQAKPQL